MTMHSNRPPGWGGNHASVSGSGTSSEIRSWLESEKDELAAIARKADVSPELVHLATVLVLVGLTDAQILDQIELVKPRTDSRGRHTAGVARSLADIRKLTVLRPA